MIPTKARTAIWTGQSLAAGAANTNSTWVDLSASFGASIAFRLTMGSAPTAPAQVQVQVANGFNAGSPVLPVNYGAPFIGGTAASEVDQFTVEIPIGWAAVRLVAGSNTGSAVTVDADISVVSPVS